MTPDLDALQAADIDRIDSVLCEIQGSSPPQMCVTTGILTVGELRWLLSISRRTAEAEAFAAECKADFDHQTEIADQCAEQWCQAIARAEKAEAALEQAQFSRDEAWKSAEECAEKGDAALALAARRLELVRGLEWSGRDPDNELVCCPECGGLAPENRHAWAGQHVGHKPGCALAQELETT